MTPTHDLGSSPETIRLDDIPQDVIPPVRDPFSDTVEAIMAGFAATVVRIRHAGLSCGPTPRQAQARPSDLRLSTSDSALAGRPTAEARFRQCNPGAA